MQKNKSDNIEKTLKKIKDENIEFVDFRFTDPKGTVHHITYERDAVESDILENGIFFDGSSIAGWKGISESDMILMPDLNSQFMDSFFAQPTLAIFGNILEPGTELPYNRDPRSTALKAENYMRSVDIADQAYFGPEAEFFLFDDVKWNVEKNKSFHELRSIELGDKNYEFNIDDKGYRPSVKGGYMPLPPVDAYHEIRSEMLSMMKEFDIGPEKHHHEVAQSQQELGIKFNSLVKICDNLQLYKYIVKQVASSFGKTATFMPKPIYDDNGSGMHVHQSLWKNNEPLFSGDQYADLSETCLYYIGGILKHAKALNAFTNPTTNSYKRLVPGFEAPVLIAYSARNRSASIRIPYSLSAKAKRIETRFPDPTCNPYLGFSALLMAGIDGIQNRIHPGDPMDKDLYNLPPEEKKNIPSMAASLEEALTSLENDHSFLTNGDVFSEDQINAYIELRREDVTKLKSTPHSLEFDMYYNS